MLLQVTSLVKGLEPSLTEPGKYQKQNIYCPMPGIDPVREIKHPLFPAKAGFFPSLCGELGARTLLVA